jgi:hypothetical protein
MSPAIMRAEFESGLIHTLISKPRLRQQKYFIAYQVERRGRHPGQYFAPHAMPTCNVDTKQPTTHARNVMGDGASSARAAARSRARDSVVPQARGQFFAA